MMGDNEALRGKVMDFLLDGRMTGLLRSQFRANEAAQTVLLELITKSAGVLSGEQSKKLLNLVAHNKNMKTEEGQAKIMAVVNKMAGLESEFDSSDAEAVMRFTQGFQMALPYINRGASGAGWVSIIFNNLLPAISSLPVDAGMLLPCCTMCSSSPPCHQPPCFPL